jgi:hypothetical protein
VKYGSMAGGWCTNQVMGTYGVGVWKHIRRGWECFSKFIKFEVGMAPKLVFGMIFGVVINR